MMKICRLAVVLGFVSVTATGFAQQVKLSPEVKQAMDAVSADKIKADITYLADDKLKGRGPGTEGYQMAVDYVVAQLKGLNVKPAGEDGTWLQKVRLRKSVPQNAQLSINSQTVEEGSYVFFPNPAVNKINVSAGLVFAGYGISEPSLGYDDYAGLDVKGKVVIVTRGAPERFPSSVMAHVITTDQILKSAANHGAVGVFIALATSTARMPRVDDGIYSVLGEKGEVVVSATYNNQISVLAAINPSLLIPLMQQTGKDLQQIIDQLRRANQIHLSLIQK